MNICYSDKKYEILAMDNNINGNNSRQFFLEISKKNKSVGLLKEWVMLFLHYVGINKLTPIDDSFLSVSKI